MKIDFASLPDVVAIVGSRSFSKPPKTVVETKMRKNVFDFAQRLKDGTIVASGEAIGVDSYAKEAARAFRLGYEPFEPDDNLPSPQRFFERNTELVDWISVNKGVIIAFIDEQNWDGTRDTLTKAKRAHVPYAVYVFRQPPLRHVKTSLDNLVPYVI